MTVFRTAITNGDECFPAGDVDTKLSIDKDQDSATANINFFFTAKNRDEKDVKYLLVLDGVISGGVWPAVDDPSLINGGGFSMRHNNGPGKKTMCLGDGDLDFDAIVSSTP